MDFADRLHQRIRDTGSRVCLGIDPRPDRSPLTDPEALGHDRQRVADAVADVYEAILRDAHAYLACCKPQSAFFEALGLEGLVALSRVMAVARELELPIILDAKRGDIGSTAEAYARAYLTDGALAADALTVNPYLGLDTLEPFLEAAEAGERGVFVLVKTSNPGSSDLQDLHVDEGLMVHEVLAGRLAARAQDLRSGERGYTALGAVVGATHREALAALRRRLPRSVLLVPGVGAQGAGPADVIDAFDADGLGAVVNASRSLFDGEAESVDALAGNAADRARRLRDGINGALEQRA
ncbi:MAG TPA: orotidine-5'-phosphate decarboxylase [Trueperaceae bacterium]|nr:orotidine-5'-phosphate decarboxylase [Trueperaceae bacterium]